MSQDLTLHVFASDLPDEQSRRLLDWCVAHGADTFTVSVIGSRPDMERFAAEFEARLAPFAADPACIPPIPEGRPGAFWTRPFQLWRLTSESIDILWTSLSRGLLSYYPGAAAWLEDPALYRGPDLMLGVVSHESEGVLRIHPAEQLALLQAEIPFRLKGEWVGY